MKLRSIKNSADSRQRDIRLFLFKLRFPLSILLFFLSQQVYSWVPQHELYAPVGFHWEEYRTDHKVTLKLARNENGSLTDIFYQFNGNTSVLLDENGIDGRYEVIVPKPGRILWEPHQGQSLSLEELFLEALEKQGYTGLRLRSLKKESGQFPRYLYSNIQDYLTIARQQNNRVSYQSIVNEIHANLNATRAKAQTYFNRQVTPPPLVDPLHNYLAKQLTSSIKKVFSELLNVYSYLDVVEPIESPDESGDKTEVNAFGLLAVDTLPKQGWPMLKAIEEMATQRICPLSYVFHRTELPLSLRLAVLSLLTHNHTSEFNFIRAVIATWGADQAWQTAKALNKLYAVDRNCWQQKTTYSELRFNAALKAIYPYDPKDFTSQWNHYSVVLKSSKGKDLAFLAYKKIYHFYGGLILAARMHDRLAAFGLPTLMIDQLPLIDTTVAAGTSYRWITSGSHSQEYGLISALYTEGAKIGLIIK